MNIIMPTKGEATMAREKLKPYWTAWAKENGPEYEKALASILIAIGK